MEVAVINNNIFSSRALSQPDQPAHNGRMNELVDFFSKKLRNFSKETCRICHEKKKNFVLDKTFFDLMLLDKMLLDKILL